MKKIMIILMLLSPFTFLSGCATSSDSINARTIVLTKCPTLRKYSTERLVRAAQSLKILPKESDIAELVDDYGKLRNACRKAETLMKNG